MSKGKKLMKLVEEFGVAVKLQNPTAMDAAYTKLEDFAEELDKRTKK